MTKEITKSLPVSKWMVYNSYLKVIAKEGSAGIENQSIEQFHENLSGNLNKIWNRMASGSYFPPPVRPLPVSGKQGGKRPPDISIISDRIAQGVAKDYLELTLENIFHSSSFGNRSGRSALAATKQYQENCARYAWAIRLEIGDFFGNISHEIMLRLLQHHIQEDWIMLYAERWLKAGVEQEDGTLTARVKGIPQDGVISPLFANIYLHYSFDKWMDEVNTQNPFERYAGDIVIHCNSRDEAWHLLEKLKSRMHQYELELHPEKTEIVYCKNSQRSHRIYNKTGVKDGFSRKNPLVLFFTAISQHFQNRHRRKAWSAARCTMEQSKTLK